MAALFVPASSQYLNNSSPPVLDYPISVGMWVNLTVAGVGQKMFWSLSDTGTTNNYLYVGMNTAEDANIGAAAGGADAIGQMSTAMIGGDWTYVVARFISSTNRRLAQLMPAISFIQHVQNTTATAPTGMDTSAIGAKITSAGASNFWDGMIAEFWLTNTDIQPDGLQLQETMFRQLAYGGPFSVPHIAKDIIEYRSFRKYPSSDGDDGSEVFHGAAGRQVWTNTNGVTIGTHPPLPYWYVKPGQVQTELVI